MARRPRTVWIITHFEFLGPPYWRDEAVLTVASTRARALRILRETHVDPGTWWGIQQFPVDDCDTPECRQVLYSRTGRVMRHGYSREQALRLGRKTRARNASRFRAWKGKKEEGRRTR